MESRYCNNLKDERGLEDGRLGACSREVHAAGQGGVSQ